MIDDFARDLHRLQKADSLIGKLWLNVVTRQVGLFAFAALIAVFGLGLINVAGFFALRAPVGPVWAAVIVAIADFVLAAIVTQVAMNSGPGPEFELAFDVRKMAIDAVQADARDLEVAIDSLGQEIRDAKDSVVGFVNNPLDAVAQNLIPGAVSIIKGLRPRKDQA